MYIAPGARRRRRLRRQDAVVVITNIIIVILIILVIAIVTVIVTVIINDDNNANANASANANDNNNQNHNNNTANSGPGVQLLEDPIQPQAPPWGRLERKKGAAEALVVNAVPGLACCMKRRRTTWRRPLPAPRGSPIVAEEGGIPALITC